jgi:hypothetical protein
LLTGRNAGQVATSFFSNSRDCIESQYFGRLIPKLHAKLSFA